MYIWRVENTKGEGCYRNEKTFLFLEYHNKSKNHPTPFGDKKIQRGCNDKEICGFKNLLQALKWFSLKDLLLLKIIGYDLKQVVVTKITVYGNRQVLAVK